MQIAPIKNNINNITNSTPSSQVSFEQGNESFWKSDYKTGQKLTVAGTTALGVFSSLAILAKCRGKSIKPKEFWKFLKTMPVEFTEVITMGIGTCLGGLLGGYLIDKNPINRKAKRREAIMQIGNISIPIGVVKLTDMALKSLKVGKKSIKDKSIRATSSIAAIIAGIYLANYLMNKTSNLIFKESNNERGVKGTDLFPHIDDVLVSAGYAFPSSTFIHSIQRIVPLALMVPGNEIGNKKA